MLHHALAASSEPGSYYLSQILIGAAIGVPIALWFIRTLIQNHRRAVAHKAWRAEQKRLGRS